jgi:L-asparaginase
MFANGMHKNADGCAKFDSNAPTVLKDNICSDVFLLKLIPGTNPDFFDALLNMKYRGVVLEAFGTGGMHIARRNLLPKIKMFTDHGIIVVICSQCVYEPSDLTMYEVGSKFLSYGVIQGKDMTTEAVVTKLMWALGQTDSLGEVRRIFNTCYAGEVTLPCQ